VVYPPTGSRPPRGKRAPPLPFYMTLLDHCFIQWCNVQRCLS